VVFIIEGGHVFVFVLRFEFGSSFGDQRGRLDVVGLEMLEPEVGRRMSLGVEEHAVNLLGLELVLLSLIAVPAGAHAPAASRDLEVILRTTIHR
jgi:hypothetical protein